MTAPLLSETIIGHSAGPDGEPQPLIKHLQGVALRAELFGRECGLAQEAKLAGLWHDMGKVTDQFQRKLSSEKKLYAPHKGLGALLSYTSGWFLPAYVISGHHGGLPQLSDIKSSLTSSQPGAWSAEPDWREKINQLKQEIPDWFPDKRQSEYKPLSPTSLDLCIRMLFSCLVDADFLDTEAHFNPELSNRRSDFPVLSDLADRFFLNQESFLQKAKLNPLNVLRQKLYDQSVASAIKPPGIFCMTIPTGGGKTRTALGFAFTHANKFHHHRVIVALPYTSIIDQIAGEYHKIFGNGAFLEHHSGMEVTVEKEQETVSAKEVKRRLACENWDANLILTTTVQLFDSLFSSRPSACRKLHRLARSIIILDEVQTLPTQLLEPICDILLELVRSYGVTLLLSTATQPALDRVNVPDWEKFDRGEVTSDPEGTYRKMIRVNYDLPREAWEWDRVTDEMMTSPRSMTILNTKSQAVELFKRIRERDNEALHLSTFLCGAHRRKVIEEVKHRLKKKKPCHLVTTQVVEAGVDIDFPLVLRASGPLDRVVQAAGRCNREGKLKRGRVVVFKPIDNKMPPGEYRHGADLFICLVNEGSFIPEDPTTFEYYFSQLFNNRNLDGYNINDLRNVKTLNFPEVAKRFHLIEQGGLVTVVVGYDGKDNRWGNSPAQKIIDKYSYKKEISLRVLFRELGPYMVNVFEHRINELKSNGLVIIDESTGIHCWTGDYDEHIGIADEKFDIRDMVH